MPENPFKLFDFVDRESWNDKKDYPDAVQSESVDSRSLADIKREDENLASTYGGWDEYLNTQKSMYGLNEPKDISSPVIPESIVSPEASEPANKYTGLLYQQKIKDLLKPDIGQKSLDFTQGVPTQASGEKLKELQKQSALDRMIGNVGLGSMTVAMGQGASAEALKPVGEVYKNISQEGEQRIKDYGAQLEMEKRDPNSSFSKGFRDYVKKAFGYDIKGDISAHDLEKTYLGPMLKQYENEENRKVQMATALMKAEEMRMMKQGMLDEKKYRQASQQLEGITKTALTTPALRAPRDRMAISSGIFATVGIPDDMSLEQVESLDAKQFNKLNRTFVAETAVELNKLLTGAGVPAQSTFKKLLPNNIAMDVASIQDYLTNKMNPAQQGEFIKQVLKTTARVRDNSQKQLDENFAKMFSGTSRIREQIPEDYDSRLRALGISQDMVNLISNKSQKQTQTSMKSIQKGMSSGKTPSKSDTVRVKKDGRILEIPRSKLDQALKDGAEEFK